MGLDMYLSARRYLRTWGDSNDIETINQLNAVHGLEPVAKDEFNNPISASEIKFDAAYWRKANAVHLWFVQHVQNGEDECKEHYVEREQLQELIDTCKKVLADHSLAPTLLPSQSGFFFGSTDYDEWYFNDLKYTVERLEKVLATPAFEHCDFYYQSSW